MQWTLLCIALSLSAPPNNTSQPTVTITPPVIEIIAPKTAEDRVPVTVKVKGAYSTTLMKQHFNPPAKWKRDLKFDDGIGFEFTAKPAKYHYVVECVDFDRKIWATAEADIEILADGTPDPVPPGPQPPVPPGPVPPGPTPPPMPTTPLISEAGFHVLIKMDRDDTTRSTEERMILYGADVRDWLDANCPPSLDGGKGYRMYPFPASGVLDPWKAAYDATQGELPTATISKDGKTGWAGSIKGMTADAFLKKCQEIKAAP